MCIWLARTSVEDRGTEGKCTWMSSALRHPRSETSEICWLSRQETVNLVGLEAMLIDELPSHHLFEQLLACNLHRPLVCKVCLISVNYPQDPPGFDVLTIHTDKMPDDMMMTFRRPKLGVHILASPRAPRMFLGKNPKHLEVQ